MNQERRNRRYAYVYLLNLIIPVSFLSLFPLHQILIGGAMIAAFAGAYLATFRVKRWRASLVLLQVALMMGLMGYLNGAYIWMIFYPLACIATLFKGRRGLISVAVMTAALLAENFVLSLHHPYAISDWLLILAATVAGIGTYFGMIWQTQMVHSREQLHSAHLEIERLSKVAERERISRDLHDVMGHELSMITLKSQLATKLIDRDADRAKSEIRDIEHAARQALTRVREYISGMRHPDLTAEWHDAVKLLSAAGITCDADSGMALHQGGRPELEAQLANGQNLEEPRRVLAMCLREAITNLVRYSGATRCHLKLQQGNGTLSLELFDNGKGVQTSNQGQNSGGNGINGMRARVANVGGRFTMWSNGEVVGPGQQGSSTPSPWPTGVALLIAIPCQIACVTEEGHG